VAQFSTYQCAGTRPVLTILQRLPFTERMPVIFYPSQPQQKNSSNLHKTSSIKTTLNQTDLLKYMKTGDASLSNT